jgi:hypothetical protein
MADVDFTAFVEDVKEWMMKTSEPHREQINNEWQTTSRTYRVVKAAYGVSIDFSQFQKGDRVKVAGKEMTKKREYNGQTYYDLICKAETITKIVPTDSRPAASFPNDPDAPF